VARQGVDALGQKRDLDLRGAGVALVQRVLLQNRWFFFLCHLFHLVRLFAAKPSSGQVNTAERFSPKAAYRAVLRFYFAQVTTSITQEGAFVKRIFSKGVDI
jgi:hypothetical protein